MRNLNFLTFFAVAISLTGLLHSEASAQTNLVARTLNPRSASAQNNNLLRRMAAQAQERQAAAAGRLREIEREAREAAERAQQETARASQDTLRALQEDINNGRARVINEISCLVENGQRNLNANFRFGERERNIVALERLLPNDSSFSGLGLALQGSIQAGQDYRFEVVDLRDSNRIVRAGTLRELGLRDLALTCDSTQRIIRAGSGGEISLEDHRIKLLERTERAADQGAQAVIGAVPGR